jgi:ankyrin repeat protein
MKINVKRWILWGLLLSPAMLGFFLVVLVFGFYLATYRDRELLFESASNGDLQKVKFLVEEKKISVNAQIINKEPPIIAASMRGHWKVVDYLIEKNAKVNVKSKLDGLTPLHYAIKNDIFAVIQNAIKHGADINAKSAKGYTPIYLAMLHGCDNIVKYLIECGADINIENYKGETPLMRAILYDQLDIVKRLIENKESNVNEKNILGDTPLHDAASLCRLEIIKYLIANGADINAKNNSEQTHLFYSILSGVMWMQKIHTFFYSEGGGHSITIRSGNFSIVKYLIENGVDVNIQDKESKRLYTML